jgi:phage repressor protein C with HTH and peptisase S24 domain
MDVGKRVKECREALKMSQKELARRAGLTQPTISSLENGKSHSSGSLASIAKELGVSALWLETGRGNKEPTKHRSFRRIYPDGATSEEYEIRLLESKGSCGSGRHAFEHTEKEPLIKEAKWFKKYDVKPEHIIAIYADGDSMSDFIVDGDIVIFRTAIDDIKSGKIYALDTPDGLRIKRLHRRVDGSVLLASDNPDKTRYPDELYTGEQARNLVIMGQFLYRQGGG